MAGLTPNTGSQLQVWIKCKLFLIFGQGLNGRGGMGSFLFRCFTRVTSAGAESIRILMPPIWEYGSVASIMAPEQRLCCFHDDTVCIEREGSNRRFASRGAGAWAALARSGLLPACKK